MKRITACCVLPAAIMLVTGDAWAASCSVSAVGVAFGAYSHLNPTPLDSTGTVTVTCTADNIVGLLETVTYSIQLSSGSAGSFAPRKMASGVNRLDYNLYVDPTRLAVWGTGAGGTTSVPGTIVVRGSLLILGQPETKSNVHTTYGRVPSGQIVPVGAYSDTITVTVIY